MPIFQQLRMTWYLTFGGPKRHSVRCEDKQKKYNPPHPLLVYLLDFFFPDLFFRVCIFALSLDFKKSISLIASQHKLVFLFKAQLMWYILGSLSQRTCTVMIFNEACLNNYANLQSTRIKSSDQSFHDRYHVFLTPLCHPHNLLHVEAFLRNVFGNGY